MKALGTCFSHDMTFCAVIYREKSGRYTVADRDPQTGRESNFATEWEVFSAVHEAERRVREYAANAAALYGVPAPTAKLNYEKAA